MNQTSVINRDLEGLTLRLTGHGELTFFGGWLLIFLTFLIIILNKRFREDANLLLSSIVVMTLHHMVSWIQVVRHGLPMCNSDALVFNKYARLGMGVYEEIPYARTLRKAYLFFDGDHFFGCQTSNVAFALSLVFFVKLIDLLDLQKHAARLVLVFSLMPSCLLMTSVTLRESWQQLFTLMAVAAAAHIAIKGWNWTELTHIPIALLAISQLHQALVLVSLCLAIFTLCYFVRQHKLLLAIIAIGLASGVFISKNMIINRLTQNSKAINSIVNEEGIDYIEQYAERVSASRSAFKNRLSFGSPVAFVKSGVYVTSQYLFAPYPWQASHAKDIYALLENGVRFIIFAGAVGFLWNRRKDPNIAHFLFIASAYLIVELYWASGSANAGQAIRHRLMAWPLLVLLGLPPLLEKYFPTLERNPDDEKELRRLRRRGVLKAGKKIRSKRRSRARRDRTRNAQETRTDL